MVKKYYTCDYRLRGIWLRFERLLLKDQSQDEGILDSIQDIKNVENHIL